MSEAPVRRYKDKSAVYAAKKVSTSSNALTGLRHLKETLPPSTQQLPQLELPVAIQDRLFDHQRFGVNWMFHLFCNKSGGILGDDMGLGKTFQVVSLMTGLMVSRRIQRVLIIAPVSVLPSWQRELKLHLEPHVPSMQLHVLNSDMSKTKRSQILLDVFRNPKDIFVISSHQMVTNMIEEFSQGCWDYVVLDEGHVIKNPSTKMFKAMQQLHSQHRLLLTGTPIQNKLEEFWAVVDWATQSRTFGPLSNFSRMIAEPIAKGQHPNATEIQILSANEAREVLSRAIKPILLQRKKKEQPQESLRLPEKQELVLWVNLSSEQRKIYQQYIQSTNYSQAFSRGTFPVEVINYLKTLCRHPLLLEIAKRRKQSKSDDVDALSNILSGLSVQAKNKNWNEEVDNFADFESGHYYEVIRRIPTAEEILRGSVKLRVLVKLISALSEKGHRTLVFSQSKLMLQIMETVLQEFEFSCFKIDGSTSLKERQSIIDRFNDTSPDYDGPRICLLTTKACGCGITLTGADRVIIFDPSWNPAEDRQAVDRAYRIGQTKPVIVYRMIQASCVEEKVYEKQVFKEGLRVIGEKGIEVEKYFAGHAQLRELLDLGPAKEAKILGKIRNQPAMLRTDDIAAVTGIVGCTRHDELYNEHDENTSVNHSQNDAHITPMDGTELERKKSISDKISVRMQCAPPSHASIVVELDQDETINFKPNKIREARKRNVFDDYEDEEKLAQCETVASHPTDIIDLSADSPAPSKNKTTEEEGTKIDLQELMVAFESHCIDYVHDCSIPDDVVLDDTVFLNDELMHTNNVAAESPLHNPPLEVPGLISSKVDELTTCNDETIVPTECELDGSCDDVTFAVLTANVEVVECNANKSSTPLFQENCAKNVEVERVEEGNPWNTSHFFVDSCFPQVEEQVADFEHGDGNTSFPTHRSMPDTEAEPKNTFQSPDLRLVTTNRRRTHRFAPAKTPSVFSTVKIKTASVVRNQRTTNDDFLCLLSNSPETQTSEKKSKIPTAASDNEDVMVLRCLNYDDQDELNL